MTDGVAAVVEGAAADVAFPAAPVGEFAVVVEPPDDPPPRPRQPPNADIPRVARNVLREFLISALNDGQSTHKCS